MQQTRCMKREPGRWRCGWCPATEGQRDPHVSVAAAARQDGLPETPPRQKGPCRPVSGVPKSAPHIDEEPHHRAEGTEAEQVERTATVLRKMPRG
jgi:hypothetical protein